MTRCVRALARVRGLVLLGALACAFTGSVDALTLGRPAMISALGQPLSLAFALQLSPGESLTADCVRTEVLAGDSRLAPGQVQVLLEGDSETLVHGLRLVSSVPINEPVLTVNLSLGCPARLSRQFTAFVDPPGGEAELPSVPTVAQVLAANSVSSPSPSPSPAPVPALSPVALTPTVVGASNAPANPVVAPAAVASAATPAGSRAEARAMLKVAAAAPPQVSSASAASAASVAHQAVKHEPQAAPHDKVLAQLEPPHARLQLDAAEVLTPPPTPAASVAASAPPAASAAAALAAASVPDPNAERLKRLEDRLDQLQAQHRATEFKMLTLRDLIDYERGQRYQNPVVYVLGVLVLVLGAVCYYLMRARQRERAFRDSAWWSEVQALQRESRSSSAGSGFLQAGLGAPVGRQAEALPHAIELSADEEASEAGPTTASIPLLGEALSESTLLPLPRSTRPAAALPTMLPAPPPLLASSVSASSVETLIDIEQQVEFFVMLGQGGSAIDLLSEHFDANGGPWPQLLLLEVCQRLGNADDFAVFGAHYALQFGHVQPAWAQSMSEGPGLDGCPELLAMLQAIWSDCGATMDLLQGLLVRGGHWQGCEIALAPERFYTLPMLRDLLLLFCVARDLSEQEVRSGEIIDLYLPLEVSSGVPGSTAMMATMGWQQSPGNGLATVGVDLELAFDESGSERLAADR